MAVYVLVHGTGCGGWIWKKLSPLLRADGREVFTPTLTGVGDRSHLLNCNVDLSTHITDVANLIEYEDLSNVILVGQGEDGRLKVTW